MKRKNNRKISLSSNSPGDLLGTWRTSHQISKEKMVEVCGISQSTLEAIESGRRNITVRTALRLAAFMGLSPDALLFPNGYEREPDYMEVIKRLDREAE